MTTKQTASRKAKEDGAPAPRPVAFRCKACGRLEHAEHAGEDWVPHACTVCGKGVVFAPDLAALKKFHPPAAELSAEELDARVVKNPPWGVKFIDQDNWEVLADADPDRLEELGVHPDHVTRHGGTKRAREGKAVAAEAQESVGAADRAG